MEKPGYSIFMTRYVFLSFNRGIWETEEVHCVNVKVVKCDEEWPDGGNALKERRMTAPGFSPARRAHTQHALKARRECAAPSGRMSPGTGLPGGETPCCTPWPLRGPARHVEYPCATVLFASTGTRRASPSHFHNYFKVDPQSTDCVDRNRHNLSIDPLYILKGPCRGLLPLILCEYDRPRDYPSIYLIFAAPGITGRKVFHIFVWKLSLCMARSACACQIGKDPFASARPARTSSAAASQRGFS